MIYSVIDIEANGLLRATPKAKKATKIHCLCYTRYNNGEVVEMGVLIEKQEMCDFLLNEPIIVGHNIVDYDIPLVEMILGIKVKATLIDTLGLSWYLYPKRVIHGLEEWGKEFGIEKPPIADWENEEIDVYIYRCSEDVRINCSLFKCQTGYLKAIYGKEILPIMSYLTYKLKCAREAQVERWRLDIPVCKRNYDILEKKMADKRHELGLVMPPVITYKMVQRPNGRYYKKDGTISKAGEKWEEILMMHNAPIDCTQEIRVIDKQEPGNPNSPEQVKAWLDSMGWIPETFKYVKERDETGRIRNRAIPQIMADDDSGVCSSIKKMFAKYPFLANLEEYSVLKHRVGLLKGFLRDVDDEGFLRAEIKGFTNTLRFQHKTIVNLPQMPKKYWDMVRGCLIAPSKDYELCGADMSSLEDNTKQHYIYYFDPQYVKEMRIEGWDAHLDIAKLAGLLNDTQVTQHKLYDKTKGKEGVSHKAVRLKAKKVNFAAVYGAGPAKLSITASISLKEATVLHTTYWKRNYAVKKVANSCKVKTVNGQKWLYNPVSKFWLSLREEKDRFSTLNQSTGVFCFDTWVRFVRMKGWKLCGQFHDEIIVAIRKGMRNQITADLNWAIEQTNNLLKLNVPLGISVAFGNNYAEIH